MLVNLGWGIRMTEISVMSNPAKLPPQFAMDTRNVPRANRSLIPLPSQPVQFATVAPPTGTAGSVTTPGLPAGLALHATNQSSLQEIPEANSTWDDAPRVDHVAMDVRLARVRAQVNILSASAGPSPARNGSDAPLQPSPFEPLEVYQICSLNNAPNSVQRGDDESRPLGACSYRSWVRSARPSQRAVFAGGCSCLDCDGSCRGIYGRSGSHCSNEHGCCG